MEYQFRFLSYVDDILVVCRCIQINALIFTFMSLKCFLKSLCPKYRGQFFGKVIAYEYYSFH